MPKKNVDPPARIDLIPARRAPKILLLRRKPSKVFHLILLDTRARSLTYGAWFQGRIYSARSDISADGEWFVYFAMGKNGCWSGISKPPSLTNICDQTHDDTWYGGGFWNESDTLVANGWSPASKLLPFSVKKTNLSAHAILNYRRKAKGWHSNEANESSETNTTWTSRPTKKHPLLSLAEDHRYQQTVFHLEGMPASWNKSIYEACWDCDGNLIVSTAGRVELYTLSDIQRGEPSARYDFEDLLPPWTRKSQQ